MFNNSNGYSLADIAAATGSDRGYGSFGGDGAWWIIILFLFCFAGWGGNGGFGGSGGGPLYTRDINDSFNIHSLLDGQTAINANVSNGFYNQNTNLLTGLANTNSMIAAGTNAIQTDIGAANTAALQNTYTLSTQLNNMAATNAQCCCENKMLVESKFADLNYNLATVACQNRQTTMDNARDIIDNNNANTRSILDFLIQDKLDSLHAENSELRGQLSQASQNAYLLEQLRPTPYPAYIVNNPYYSAGYYATATYAPTAAYASGGCNCGGLA